MTTVIIPGAPVRRPVDPRIILPARPIWNSGQVYRNWYRKYGSLDNYKAYKRTRQWRAGGARHGGGDDYEHEYNKDPLSHAWNDVSRYIAGRPWNSNLDDSEHSKNLNGVPLRFNKYKPGSTDHWDQRDSRMRSKSPWSRQGNYAYTPYGDTGRSLPFIQRRWGYGKIINAAPASVKRIKAIKRTMRYRRFRPGFFKRDDHY
jgi:hypothetical protein